MPLTPGPAPGVAAGVAGVTLAVLSWAWWLTKPFFCPPTCLWTSASEEGGVRSAAPPGYDREAGDVKAFACCAVEGCVVRVSIIDMIGRAGGMTADSAQKVIFVPAKYDERSEKNVDSGGTLTLPQTARDAPVAGTFRPTALEDETPFSPPRETPSGGLSGRRWVVIDLAHQQAHACLDLPTRPGDVVVVPIAGEVMVQGWVKNPGAFKIIPDLTILGAISAAGGALFSNSVEVLRTDSNGHHIAKQFDLSELGKGRQMDAQVQSGDVVVVEKTAAGAIPYGLYQVFQHFGTGLGFGVPMP